MRISRVALALVSALVWAVAPGAHSQSGEEPSATAPEEAAPEPPACPVIESLGPSASHIFQFPAEETSLAAAEHVAPDGSRRSGQEGIDLVVDIIVRSLRPGCTPILLVNVVGGADFDPQGTRHEDSVSVTRMWTGVEELNQALEAVRAPAVERGEILNLPVKFSGGGIGTRFAQFSTPESEDERRANRFVRLRLIQVVTSGATGDGTVTRSPSKSSEPALLP